MTDFAELAERYLVLIEGGPPTNYSAWSPAYRAASLRGTLSRRRNASCGRLSRSTSRD
jgi:hypothetical protein